MSLIFVVFQFASSVKVGNTLEKAFIVAEANDLSIHLTDSHLFFVDVLTPRQRVSPRCACILQGPNAH